jgi:protein-S-isoprenylcysteine O-methyltransferase Ste14
LFNVQSAAAEASQAKRELTLNAVVTALASLTLISVSVDADNFIREDQSLITDRLQRALILGQFVLALVLLVFIFWLISCEIGALAEGCMTHESKELH